MGWGHRRTLGPDGRGVFHKNATKLLIYYVSGVTSVHLPHTPVVKGRPPVHNEAGGGRPAAHAHAGTDTHNWQGEGTCIGLGQDSPTEDSPTARLP